MWNCSSDSNVSTLNLYFIFYYYYYLQTTETMLSKTEINQILNKCGIVKSSMCRLYCYLLEIEWI